jgi:hypothetical protein
MISIEFIMYSWTLPKRRKVMSLKNMTLEVKIQSYRFIKR